eukprot:gene11222-21406_t
MSAKKLMTSSFGKTVQYSTNSGLAVTSDRVALARLRTARFRIVVLQSIIDRYFDEILITDLDNEEFLKDVETP